VFAGWFVATNLLVWLAHDVGWLPFKVLLFACVAFLPGTALLRVMRITLRTLSARIAYSFGLSVLVLMLSGLAANTLLPMFGVVRPLELAGALGTWDVVTAGLIMAGIFTNSRVLRLKQWDAAGFSRPEWILAGLSLLLPCGAIMGAFRLNNGGDALLAEITLGLGAALIVYAFLLRKHLSNELLAWFIFSLGLSVLLMTSLRGWDITGHDIEREFRVYTLTHLNGRWDIGLDRDPYNACLSITILPEMFAKLLGISGLMVFKVVLQVIFAVCPVAVFMLLRQYTSKLGALSGSMLFLCYPTFINDSAMLTRQGVAYLFFALALLVVSNKAQKKRYKLLFSFCALGAVLSHYSTAYMFVAIFILAVICKMVVSRWYGRRNKKLFQWRPRKPHVRHTVLSVVFALLLFGMTFGWYSRITATSSGLFTTLRTSLTGIPTLFSKDNSKSSDTATALLFSGGKTQVDLYQSYMIGSAEEHTTKAASDIQYSPLLASDDLPLTPLGKKAKAVGLDPSRIASLRQYFAKALQLLALIGVVYVTYRLLRKRPGALGVDFICLSLAGFVILVLLVLLPVLSINYGVLRAFQQILIFLILPIILLLARVTRRLWPGLKKAAATTGVTLLFLLFTGFFAQILGGTSPALSLNNKGLYYGLYSSSEADRQSFAWIKQHIPKGSDVRAANFNRAIMHDPGYPFKTPGILPSQIGANSYVYLDPAQVESGRLYTYFESSPLVMTFPLDYYDMALNKIYSTSSTRVYQ
jgi:uncharacterized membrane protein